MKIRSSRAMARAAIILVAGVVAALPMTTSALAQSEVNIYSYRQSGLIKPLLDAFTKQTGITTRVIFAKKGLSQRIASEGANSPADVMLTVDVGRLAGAKRSGITQAVSSDEIIANIPAQYRDPDGHWFGVTTRARVVFASRERVEQKTITYEELAEPQWKRRICTRSGQHVYSIGLFASMIAHHGVEWTENWLTGLKANLVHKPSGNDRAQVKSIYAGECDIALGNTYYMGKMQTNEKEPVQKEWADSVRVIFPNAEDRGTHVNISGMIMAKHAPNPQNARKLLEFLTSDMAQKVYAEANYEYPVKPGVTASNLVMSWGKINPDSISLSEVAKHRKAASQLVDKVGFNDGPNS